MKEHTIRTQSIRSFFCPCTDKDSPERQTDQNQNCFYTVPVNIVYSPLFNPMVKSFQSGFSRVEAKVTGNIFAEKHLGNNRNQFIDGSVWIRRNQGHYGRVKCKCSVPRLHRGTTHTAALWSSQSPQR